MPPVLPLLDFFDESLWVRVPWGKGRAPAFEVAVIYIHFHRGVKAICWKVYLCQHVAIEGLAFLGVGSADNSIFCRFVTGPRTTKFGGKLGNTVRVLDAKASGALQRLRFFSLPSLLGATAPSGHLQR
jgi:hypothetical protein